MKAQTLNPSRVDFVTLRLFCAVARTRSITKGARQCHIATSAASRRLADFEAATGTKLLERTAQGVTVTPAGHVALQHAMRLFQGFEQFSSEIGDFSRGLRGHVRLWANISSLTEFLPASLARFLDAHPSIRVEVEEQLSVDVVRAVVEGLADIGVFAENAPSHGLTVFPFQVDQLVLVCLRGHPLAKRKRIHFADCLQYDLVGLDRGSAILELTARAAAEAGGALRLRVQVRSFDAMCQMIAAGLGVGVLPLVACKPHVKAMHLRTVALADSWATRRLVIGTSAGRPVSEATQLLLEHLTQARH